MESICNITYFFDDNIALADKCYVAQTTCSELQNFINYYKIIYCDLEGSWGYFIIAFICTVLIVFRLMSIVIESHLTPAIEFITEKLSISQSLSAVTLLALANGAGDVITAIVASDTLEGVNLNIGALYGAGFFVSTLVIGVTIINSKGYIQMPASFIWRDILFYIAATFIVIIYGIVGRFSLFDSILLLAIYGLLILIVAFQDYYNQQQKKKQINDQLITNIEDLDSTEDNVDSVEYQEFQVMDQRSFADQVCCVIDIPFKLILKVCIPPSQNYSKLFCILTLAPSLCFLYFILGENSNNPYNYLYILSLSILIGTIIYSTYGNDDLPKYYIVIQFYACIVSLVWIYLLSGILIDTLSFFGMLSRLSPSYLGMTIIAMGNALPDGLVTMALAKQGYATMAMTGAYFGQVFGLLVGLGLSLLKSNLRTGQPVTFDLFNKDLISENIIMLMVIFSTLGVLFITFVYGVVKKYRFARNLSILLILIYIVVFCSVTAIALSQAI